MFGSSLPKLGSSQPSSFHFKLLSPPEATMYHFRYRNLHHTGNQNPFSRPESRCLAVGHLTRRAENNLLFPVRPRFGPPARFG